MEGGRSALETDRLLYNHACKKDTHGIRQEGKRSHQVGTCARGRGLRKREMTCGVGGEWRSVLGSEWFEPHIGTPSLGV